MNLVRPSLLSLVAIGTVFCLISIVGDSSAQDKVRDGTSIKSEEKTEDAKDEKADPDDRPKMEDEGGLARLILQARRGETQFFGDSEMHKPWDEDRDTKEIDSEALKSLCARVKKTVEAEVKPSQCPREFFLCGGNRVRLWLGDGKDADWIELRGESWAGSNWYWATTSFWPGGRWVRGGVQDLLVPVKEE